MVFKVLFFSFYCTLYLMYRFLLTEKEKNTHRQCIRLCSNLCILWAIFNEYVMEEMIQSSNFDLFSLSKSDLRVRQVSVGVHQTFPAHRRHIFKAFQTHLILILPDLILDMFLVHHYYQVIFLSDPGPIIVYSCHSMTD